MNYDSILREGSSAEHTVEFEFRRDFHDKYIYKLKVEQYFALVQEILSKLVDNFRKFAASKLR